jgi:uncharacterized BrkB/YihY/UPF0761 family membrane protein
MNKAVLLRGDGIVAEKKHPMRRRLRSTTIVLVSQMLLIALALAWLFQMVIIAREGSAYFIENNNLILYGEITIIALIIFFAIYVLVIQINRLGERRGSDRTVEDRRK